VDGIELFGDLDFGAGFSVRTAYTFLESETSTGSLLRRPRHRGNILLSYRQEGWRANLNANIVGKRDDVGARSGATIKESGYVRLDVASSYRLPWQPAGIKDFSLFAKIENLLNRRYEEADGFRARPLNFLVGLRAVFGSN
jgi:outer membrane receptor protein involved in Fe transport